MKADPFDILLQFDRWATRRLLDVCQSLDDASLDREFPIGLGTLRKTLSHVVANTEWWTDRADQRPLRPYRADADQPLDAIAARFEAAWDDLEAMLNRSDSKRLTEIIASDFDQDDGTTLTVRFPRSAVLLHLFNHGTHHRAQCLNMLRHLGLAPLPELDLIDSNQITDPNHAHSS